MREIETKRLLLRKLRKDDAESNSLFVSEIGRVTVRLQNMSHGMCIRI